jgi:glycosyltransferase involved in cell wall biosynthesis
MKLDLIDMRREVDRLRVSLALDAGGSTEIVQRSETYAGATPRVSVLVSLYEYEDLIEAALDSVAGSSCRSVEIVVVDDASRDGSLARARRWLAEHPHIPSLLARHRWNRGLPSARNSGIDLARAEFVFILDADNQMYPHGLERLVKALETDRDAVFAYGIAERFAGARSVGLLSFGAWDPRRLRDTNYIDAMALIRTESLREVGGYTTDRRLHGWEDFDLWCRFAERGWQGHAVQEIVARYRASPTAMLGSVTDISLTDAFVALIERSPGLMRGVEPPL